jgi:hypothetical protein
MVNESEAENVKGLLSWAGSRPIHIVESVNTELHRLFLSFAKINNFPVHRINTERASDLIDLFYLDGLRAEELECLYGPTGSWWATEAGWRNKSGKNKPATGHIADTLYDARDWWVAQQGESSDGAEVAWDEFMNAARVADLNVDMGKEEESEHAKRRRAGMRAAGPRSAISGFGQEKAKAAFTQAYNGWSGDD